MIRRTLAAALVAVLALLVPMSAAGAAVSAVGWWTRNPTASAPAGGMQVANAPDGVVSFGAARLSEDADAIASAAVVLKEEGQGLNASGAALVACPALGTWEAGSGPMAKAPKADCDAGSVALTRNDAGEWTGDVAAVLVGSTPAVAIVPAEGAGVFQVSFAAPTVTVTMRADSGSGSSSASTFDASEFTAAPTPAATSSDQPSSSTFEPSDSTFSSSSGAFTPEPTTFAPPADDTAATTETAEVAATDAAAETASGTTSFNPRPAAAEPLEVGGNRWAQFFAFLAAAAIIGTAAGFGRNRLLSRTA